MIEYLLTLRLRAAPAGDKGEQAHRTPAGAGVPGQRVSLKCAVAPLQVHREEAVLHVMLRDAAVGQSGGSFDHVVGQVGGGMLVLASPHLCWG